MAKPKSANQILADIRATEERKIYTRYDADAPSPELDFSGPDAVSVTNQSDKDSTDINVLMAQYQKTGFIMDMITGNKRQPVYGDFSNLPDYHQMKSTLARVTQAFNAYPATIRDKFKNDPALLIEYLNDPKNDAEAVSLGLKPKPKNPANSEAPSPGGETPKPDPLKTGTSLPPNAGGEPTSGGR